MSECRQVVVAAAVKLFLWMKAVFYLYLLPKITYCWDRCDFFKTFLFIETTGVLPLLLLLLPCSCLAGNVREGNNHIISNNLAQYLFFGTNRVKYLRKNLVKCHNNIIWRCQLLISSSESTHVQCAITRAGVNKLEKVWKNTKYYIFP